MNTIDEIYSQRENFVIIGLTGNHLYGSTRVAEMLNSDGKKIIQVLCNEIKSKQKLIDCKDISDVIDLRKKEIVGDFIGANWKPYIVLKIQYVILLYVYSIGFVNMFESLPVKNNATKDECMSEYNAMAENCGKAFENISEYINNIETASNDEMCMANYRSFVQYSEKIVELITKIIGDEGTVRNLFESWASQIRYKGKIEYIYIDEAKQDKNYIFNEINDGLKCWCLAETINGFIKIISRGNKDKQTMIVIEKFTCPLEIRYLRERYSTFFLWAINHETRNSENSKKKSNNQSSSAGVTPEDSVIKESLIDKENKIFSDCMCSDINSCIQLADVHIIDEHNENNEDAQSIDRQRSIALIADEHTDGNDVLSDALRMKIAKYASLTLHPGIVPPNDNERIMQIAYSVSLSSGCLSRQVGAVVTNENYSVKAVGWNSSPEGQLPCTLRSFKHLGDSTCWYESFYSDFEKHNHEFVLHYSGLQNHYLRRNAYDKLNHIPSQFCFKDLYASFSAKNKMNQVHTRSLHAEENAFLQLAKYGSSGIGGGYLYTTDRCCVLCAKKAFQLGIKKIYYINPYTDIAPTHILGCPNPPTEDVPQLIQYEGAVGPAYSKLYMPFFSQKDEIRYRTQINMKAYSPSSSSTYNIDSSKTSSERSAKLLGADDNPKMELHQLLESLVSYLNK